MTCRYLAVARHVGYRHYEGRARVLLSREGLETCTASATGESSTIEVTEHILTIRTRQNAL